MVAYRVSLAYKIIVWAVVYRCLMAHQTLDREQILEVVVAFVMGTLPEDFDGEVDVFYNENGEVEILTSEESMCIS